MYYEKTIGTQLRKRAGISNRCHDERTGKAQSDRRTVIMRLAPINLFTCSAAPMQLIVHAILVTFFLIAQVQSASAQEDLQKRIDQLGKRVDQLESKQRQPVTEIHRDAGGAVVFLFGAFCALWAQYTKRNPWLWFFLGLFFNVITVLVLLAKNSDDRRQALGEPAAAGSLVAVAIIGGLFIVAALAGIAIWLLMQPS